MLEIKENDNSEGLNNIYEVSNWKSTDYVANVLSNQNYP